MVGRLAPDPGPPVVVCVDDDPQVLSAVQRLLRREPYEVLTTDKPETALRWLVERGVQLLITDLRMPDMDGGDLVKVVEERFPETAALILTGYPDLVPTRARPRLIAKPWNDAELRDAIRALVRQREVPGRSVGLRPDPGEKIGRLLVVTEDPRIRSRAGAATLGENFDVHIALGREEGLRLIRQVRPPVEVVVGDSQMGARALRQALPDAAFVILADHPTSEEIRGWYDLGIEQVLRLSAPTQVLAAAFRHCLLRVRARREEAARRTFDDTPRAGHPWWTRARKSVFRGTGRPGRSRGGEIRTLLGFAGAAVLIGIFLGITWRAIERIPPLEFPGAGSDPMDRFWRMSIQDQALRRWYLAQELQTHREIQAETERYHELQLKQPLPARERPELSEPRGR